NQKCAPLWPQAAERLSFYPETPLVASLLYREHRESPLFDEGPRYEHHRRVPGQGRVRQQEKRLRRYVQTYSRLTNTGQQWRPNFRAVEGNLQNLITMGGNPWN